MAEFFVRRPIVAMVIAIIIVIVGVVSMGSLPVAQYPEITPPEIGVTATYTGANAEIVEQSVATPLEQKLNGVENSLYMKSVNSNDGTMNLTVSFEVGSDLDMSNVLVQNRVSEAQASIPEEVKRLGITVKKKLAFPLMLVSLYSPEGTYDQNFQSNYLTINILDAVARIKGVGQASVLGGSDYAMRVWVKPDQLAKLGLTVPDITRAIQEQNVIAPAGQIGGPPAVPGTQFTYQVRTKGRLSTAEEFGKVVVRSNPDGSQVRVKDVARVELGTQTYNAASRLNGGPAAILAVYQLPGANGLEVAAQIESVMRDLSADFPDDIEYLVSLDTTLAIEEGISEIITTLFQAVALVILVVFIFLQNWRATLIPSLAVPVSLIGTFAVFPLLGFSINTLSLLGLVLAIGIVVDDAIVVVEAVTTKMQEGLKPKAATIAAMKEVSGPIVATSLSLIAVFVPVAAMGGITGRLYQQFAITIAISVAISSINALTLSPALSAMLLRPPAEKKANFLTPFYNGFNSAFQRATGSYMGIATLFTRKLLLSIGTLLIMIVMMGGLFGVVPGGFVPEEDQGYFLVNVQLPDAASLERTDAVTRKVEAMLVGADGVDSVTAVAGYSLLTSSLSPNNAFLFVSLEHWAERDSTQLHVNNIIQQMNRKFAMGIPEAMVFAFGPPAIPGLGTGSGFSMMLQDRGGNTPGYLAEQAQAFMDEARQRPEIGNVNSTFRANVPQIYADVDRDKVLKLGVSPADVNTTLGSFLGGAYVNDFNRFGRLYKVYVQAEPEYRSDPSDIRYFFVRGNTGETVPLSALVTTSSTQGPEYTNRFNLFRAAELTGSPAPGYSSDQALDALEQVAAKTLPTDMTYSWNAMSFQERAAAGSGSTVFLLALLFVFLILAAQYESWSLPVGVLLGTPIAIFGAMAGLWISGLFLPGYQNNVFAQIGLVMLIGMAAKNAILIVEFAKLKSDEGLSALDAALSAARDRFRPILMTAFSFILGVLPLLIASGAGAEARKVMGMTVFSGMLAATVLGVLIIPALYVLVERITGRDKPSSAASSESSARPAE
ncbi:MAG: multidrug efflux RND transporter permease subunit [Xanthomonadales bacterium]|nr:multidrug efflux RND transporter permease subunit [Gammaproteobacteria bacterium]NNK52754.1 multidrug efflux RND transporter permease subunit [Xanthomonadales bacterium]